MEDNANTESQDKLWIEYNRLFLDQIKQGYSRVHAEQIARHDFILSRKSTRPDERDEIDQARNIISDIFDLTHHKDGYTPKGYGNYELNKATDAMYAYIKEIERARKLKEL